MWGKGVCPTGQKPVLAGLGEVGALKFQGGWVRWCFDRLSTNGSEMISTNRGGMISTKGWSQVSADLVILNKSVVILNEVKDLGSWLRKISAKHLDRLSTSGSEMISTNGSSMLNNNRPSTSTNSVRPEQRRRALEGRER